MSRKNTFSEIRTEDHGRLDERVFLREEIGPNKGLFSTLVRFPLKICLQFNHYFRSISAVEPIMPIINSKYYLVHSIF
jgi:hypothetical protein